MWLFTEKNYMEMLLSNRAELEKMLNSLVFSPTKFVSLLYYVKASLEMEESIGKG
jgi:hypothetical protein